jgi:hypothetical protein
MKKLMIRILPLALCLGAIAATPRAASATRTSFICGGCGGHTYWSEKCSGGTCGCSLFCQPQ